MLPSAGLALAASPWKTVRMADVGLGLTQSSRSWLNQRIRDVPTPASHPQGRRTGPQEVTSSSTDEGMGFQPQFPIRFHSDPLL